MAQDLATLSDLSSGTLLSILKTYLANEAKNQGAKLDFTKYEVQGSKIEIIKHEMTDQEFATFEELKTSRILSSQKRKNLKISRLL